MRRASRSRTLGAAVSILVALVMVPTFRITPALASLYTTCGKHLGVKATLLKPGTPNQTIAEVNGEAGLTTQGIGDCWDRGVWNFLYHTDPSRCYIGFVLWLEMTGCFRDPLTGDYWWTDSSGTRRYYNMDQHTYGNYKNVDPRDPQSGTTSTLHSRFTIRYDGTYTRGCNVTGTQPSYTIVVCDDTGIQSGR